MVPRPGGFRRLVPSIVALGLIGTLLVLSGAPTLAEHEADDMASRFRFLEFPLPELPGASARGLRDVHPSLHHMRSMISFVGAAVALADLDGDGLPNDLVYVDPRSDRVIVAPVPGTGKRYEPFSLTTSTLEFSASTMAPMGCLVGDFNEDGLADILVYYWGRSPILFLQQDAPSRPAVLTHRQFVPEELVEPYQVWYTSAVTQADLDGDGHLDLIVGNYFPDGARVLDANASGREVLPDSLSRANNGGGPGHDSGSTVGSGRLRGCGGRPLRAVHGDSRRVRPVPCSDARLRGSGHRALRRGVPAGHRSGIPRAELESTGV